MNRPLVGVNKGNLVVADDDRVIVTMLADFLKKKGFRIYSAFDSMQAMVGVRQTKPRAVILDIGMPGGGGMDVLKKLKTMNTTSQIPVLILTGSTDATANDAARDLGADEFFTKPPDLQRIYARLLEILGLPPEPADPSPVVPDASGGAAT